MLPGIEESKLCSRSREWARYRHRSDFTLYLLHLLGSLPDRVLWADVLKEETIRLIHIASITRARHTKHPRQDAFRTPSGPEGLRLVPGFFEVGVVIYAARFGIGSRDKLHWEDSWKTKVTSDDLADKKSRVNEGAYPDAWFGKAALRVRKSTINLTYTSLTGMPVAFSQS